MNSVPQPRHPAGIDTASGPAGAESVLSGVRCVAWRMELPSGEISYVSESASAVFGYPLECWRRPRFQESLLHPEERDSLLARAAEALAAGRDQTFEYRARHRDGRWLWVQDTVAVVRDAEGRPVALQGLAIDVTERRHEEQRLRHDGERLRLALAIAGVSSWEWHAERDVVLADRSGRPLLPDVEWNGRPLAAFLEAVDPADRERVYHAARRSLATGEAYTVGFRVRRPNGELRHMLVHARAQGGNGAYRTVIGATRDVTEEYRALREADEWRERFAVAARASGVTLFDNDVVADRVYWYSADGTVLGHDPARLCTLADFLALLPSDERQRFVGGHQANLAAPRGQQVAVYRVRDAAGQERAVEMRGELVWGDGAPRRWIGQLMDVTERHELESRLRMKSVALEALGEGVAVANERAIIVLANAALERMYGYPRGGLVGRSIRTLTSRSETDFWQVGGRMAAHAREYGSWSGEQVARRQDGTTIRVHLTLTTAVIGGERYWISVRKDVTEVRRLQDEVLRISQQEKDQLAHELHEGLGQQLTGASMLAASLRAEARAKDSPLAPKVERLARLVVDAVGSCRRLALGVSGFVLRHGGLEHALRELAAQCSSPADRPGVRVECRVDVDPAISAALSETQAYHLFRIAQEAAACALRHAGAARLSIVLVRDADGRGRLAIGDDGGGAPVDLAQLDRARRLMSYRAGLLGAALTVRATPEGTETDCSFPLVALGETRAGDVQ